MEPRKFVSARADAVVKAEGHTGALMGLALPASPGSESGACTEEGPPGTWEVRVSPRDERGGAPSNSQAPAADAFLRRRRAKTGTHRGIGSRVEAARDGHPDVGASHTTEEAGERTQRTPRRKGDVWAGLIGLIG